MGKTVRRLSVTSLLLLLTAAGSYYVGEWQYKNELEEMQKAMHATGFYLSDAYPDTSIWQILAGLFLLAGIAIATSALMLWRQERTDSTAKNSMNREP